MHVEEHESLEELRCQLRRAKKVKQAQRLRIVVLAMEAHTGQEIAQRVDLSERRVQYWLKRYNECGVAGLADRVGRGPAPMLTPEEVERLKARLDATPLPEDQVCTLRGQDVQRLLEREFGKRRKLGAVYKLLHKLGYSSLVPRPQHHKADPLAQEAFKKSFPSPWRRSAQPIRTAVCKSSSKTKHALANKVL